MTFHFSFAFSTFLRTYASILFDRVLFNEQPVLLATLYNSIFKIQLRKNIIFKTTVKINDCLNLIFFFKFTMSQLFVLEYPTEEIY